jgi:hypothetical protein
LRLAAATTETWVLWLMLALVSRWIV